MKNKLIVLSILVSSIVGCTKEDLVPRSVTLQLKGFFNDNWHGVSLDSNMPSLCIGQGTQSKIRIKAYAEVVPNGKGDKRKPGAWIGTQPFSEGYEPEWFHGEKKVIVGCDKFDFKVINKNYDPLANNGSGGFVDGDEIGSVNPNCMVSITAPVKPRYIHIQVRSKLRSEDIFPETPNLPVVQTNEFEPYNIDCGS